LVKTLHDPEDPKVRALATLALAQGKFGASAREIVPELVKAFQDREPQVRAGAATALKYIGRDLKDRGEMDTPAEVLVPGLVKALEVSDREVRSQAAKALGNMGRHAKDAIPALQAMLQDEGLREVATWALERIRAEE
jgi:HEAT repeat protein